MFDTGNIFNTLLVIPILNVLIGVYKLFFILHIPGALGLSLIVMTVIIRLILNPLMAVQLKNAKKLNDLKPHLDKLSEKHKGDKQALYQAQLALYKEQGVNPTAGCLPLLIQMPVLIAIYNLFFNILTAPDKGLIVENINKVLYYPFLKIATLDLSFFGLDLSHKPAEWQKFGWWLLLVPVITAVLQYYQTKLMAPAPKKEDAKIVKKEGGGEKKEEDMAVTMQKQMSIMMPLMIGFFAFSFPLGLSLYWNTYTVFGIIQQRQINKS